MNKNGFGVEDTPFMILATVAILMLTVWIGVGVMESFIKGNEYQAAVEASAEIYKRAKLLSLGYEGSSDSLSVSVPPGYSVLVDGYIVARKDTYANGSAASSKPLTEPFAIRGVDIVGEGSNTIGPGQHDVNLVYQDGDVAISWT